MENTPNGIFYKTYGKNKGYCLVFLHGYLEASSIWDNFAGQFADEYFVICIDLPGHGKSLVPSEDFSMEEMGNAVIEVMDTLGIESINLVGHSMGGYVSMAMLEKYSDRLNSVVLFHSTCFSDSDEKRANRDREIDLVRNGKKELIINTSIPRLFASSRLEELSELVEKSKIIAIQTNDTGIIAALNAMKTRSDRSIILSESKIPVLLIGGRHDNLIPYQNLEKLKKLSPKISLVCLENSGHMGFVEEPILAEKEIKNFLDLNFECS